MGNMDNKNRSISDMVGQILGIDPTVKYRASMLPLVKTKEDRVELGLPSALVSMFESFMLPGHVVQGGSYTPEDVTNMAMNVGMMGAPVGYATAPRGALGMGGSRSSNMNSAFDEWFKGSKIVDDIGQPLTVYHGYPAKIDWSSRFPVIQKLDEFKRMKGERGLGFMGATREVDSPVHFFTPDIQTARSFGVAKAQSMNNHTDEIVKAYLSIKNPYDMRLKNRNVIRSLSEAGFTPEQIKGETTSTLWNFLDTDQFIDYLKSQGYDGVITNEKTAAKIAGVKNAKDVISYGVFDPTQIKSINNTGTWNPNDPRIMYSNPATAAIPQLFNYTNQQNQ